MSIVFKFQSGDVVFPTSKYVNVDGSLSNANPTFIFVDPTFPVLNAISILVSEETRQLVLYNFIRLSLVRSPEILRQFPP